MDTTTPSSTSTAGTPDPTQAVEQLKATLSSADSTVSTSVQSLGLVHQARLSQATRTVAALTTKYGANDPRVKTAQASVTAAKTTIARVAMVKQQAAAPVVTVSKTGWALQGYVLDSNLQPLAKYTVFFADANKAFLQQYGFAYTDQTGYFVINYAGALAPATVTQLFVEVANTDANPVYLSTSAFQPVVGSTSFQNIVLPAGGQPIGDPPKDIRAVALPNTATTVKPAPAPAPAPTAPTTTAPTGAAPTAPTTPPTPPKTT